MTIKEEWLSVFKELGPKRTGRLICSLLEYATTGNESTEDFDEAVKIAYWLMRPEGEGPECGEEEII